MLQCIDERGAHGKLCFGLIQKRHGGGGFHVMMRHDVCDHDNAPENVVVLSLTSLYAITMLLVWTMWSGLL